MSVQIRPRIDRTGKRYGRLVCIEWLPNPSRWKCKCDCGNLCVVKTDKLINGDTKSCGCIKRELDTNRFYKHGETNTRLHNLWCTIRQRCNSPKSTEHEIYHDRGIRMCDEWNDYLVFKKWMLENGYDPNAPRGQCTIDRIDNNKGYSPDNCRIVDMKTQYHNRRDILERSKRNV